MATKAATNPKSADSTVSEEAWSGPKLVVIGVVTLLAAFVLLYSISPFKGILLP